MGRGHRHHRRGRGGGRRGYGGGVTTFYSDTVPDVIYCDGSIVNGVCIPDRHTTSGFSVDHETDAGTLRDIWPTFVTPDDARRYIDEVDAGYRRLDTAIAFSTAPVDFKASWSIQLASWTAFAIPAKATVGYLNTTAVMQQTDRYNEQLKNWFLGFREVGGQPPGPPPITPGQGIPGTGNTTADMTKLVTAVGITAAVILIAPKLLSIFK